IGISSARSVAQELTMRTKNLLPSIAGIALVALAGFTAVDYMQPSLWEAKADSMGVEVIFTNDHRNCGAVNDLLGGCFDAATPNVIYVLPDMGPEVTQGVVLHELAHVEQWRNEEPLDECLADTRAREWGSTVSLYDDCLDNMVVDLVK